VAFATAPVAAAAAPAGDASAPGAAAPAPALPEGAADLIGLLRARPAEDSEWKLTPEGLHSTGEGTGKQFDLRFEPPDEYDARISILRPREGDGLRLGLSTGTRQFVLELDGSYSGHCYLDRLEGLGFGGNRSLTTNRCLPTGRKVKLEIQVRRSGVRVTGDGVEILRWSGSTALLSPPADAGGLSSQKSLFLAVTRAEFLIDSYVVAPAGSAIPPKPAVAPGITDLLEHLKTRPWNNFEWKLVDGALVARTGWSSMCLDFGFEPPAEYDLKLDVHRTLPGEGLRVGLIAEGRQFVLEIDGRRRGLCFLDVLDGRRMPEMLNESVVQNIALPAGRPASVEISVRKTGVKLAVDGRAILDWKGSFTRLTRPEESFGANPRSLYLQANASEFRISRFFLALPAGSPAAKLAAEAAARPAVAAPPLSDIKTQLGSKEEHLRIQAIGWLGSVREKEARQLLGDRLRNDTELVRLAAARALAEQRHPQAVEELGKALRVSLKAPQILREILLALGNSDLCAAIPVLVGALDVDGGRHYLQVLDELQKIDCREAVGALLPVMGRIEQELKKPPLVKGKPNTERKEAVVALHPPFHRAMGNLMRGYPGAEGWAAYYAKSGGAKSLSSVHRCEKTWKLFEAGPGQAAKCPHDATPAKDGHEDVFLRHRRE
jgi:hypothetical protein